MSLKQDNPQLTLQPILNLRGQFDAIFPSLKDDLLPAHALNDRLIDAMSYMSEGGKRLRALLVYGAFLSVEDQLEENAHWVATAVELFHAFTLIHDDLPAMDDDDFRRGKPSCHKAFDEATAILCGDLLQNLAFKALSQVEIKGDMRSRIFDSFCDMSSIVMFGQMQDLSFDGDKQFNWSLIRSLYEAKTATLIATSLGIGAMCSPKSDDYLIKSLVGFGHDLGLAFQIQDDLLDAEQDAKAQDKKGGARKMSFAEKPDFAEVELNTLFEKCEKSLNDLSEKGFRVMVLRDILDWIKNRS